MPQITEEEQPYSDFETLFRYGDQYFTRIVGGIVWPGNRPGFAVVVGKEILTPNLPAQHH